MSAKKKLKYKKENKIYKMCKSYLINAAVIAMCFLVQQSDAGSCRESALCCNGRDSSCVVQKAPLNSIIEDMNDKPCYCDHACLKLGDCCEDFKAHCGGEFIFIYSTFSLSFIYPHNFNSIFPSISNIK